MDNFLKFPEVLTLIFDLMLFLALFLLAVGGRYAVIVSVTNNTYKSI